MYKEKTLSECNSFSVNNHNLSDQNTVKVIVTLFSGTALQGQFPS